MSAIYAIRSASQADETFLSELLYEALYVPPGDPPFPRSVLDRQEIAHYAFGIGTHAGDVGFIAEAGVERVGAAWRGRDIGRALLQSLAEVVPRMSLSSDSRNPATRLYRRLGFVPVADDGTSVTMLLQR